MPSHSLLLELQDLVSNDTYDREFDEKGGIYISSRELIEFADKKTRDSQRLLSQTLEKIRERKKKNGQPSYIAVDKSFGQDEAEQLKKFCLAFNLKRWREPVPIED